MIIYRPLAGGLAPVGVGMSPRVSTFTVYLPESSVEWLTLSWDPFLPGGGGGTGSATRFGHACGPFQIKKVSTKRNRNVVSRYGTDRSPGPGGVLHLRVHPNLGWWALRLNLRLHKPRVLFDNKSCVVSADWLTNHQRWLEKKRF